MPNPSELARLEEELAFCAAAAHNLSLSKSSREEYLRDARKISRILGAELGNYNQKKPKIGQRPTWGWES